MNPNRRPTPMIIVAVTAGASGGLLAAYGIYFTRAYAWSLFFLVPVATGFVASAVLRTSGPRPLSESIIAAMLSGALISSGFLVAGLEGLICIGMALPLATPFLLIGAFLGYFAFHRRRIPLATSLLMIAVVAACLTIEPSLHRSPQIEIVEDSLLVHATPSQVWSAILHLDRMPVPRDWMYRVGLACPLQARIESPRAGGYRVCTLSTGQLVEQIEVWKPGRTLRWRSRSTPPPMRELNPLYDHVDAPHLHGFYDSPRGEFAIEAVGPNLTRVTRRTWYSHRLYPSVYWSWFCELAISKIHGTVLESVRRTAAER